MPGPETSRRFHFIKEIASGGFGTVYLAEVIHPDGFSRLVAVKLLKDQWTDSDEVTRRMRDEARLLGKLRHRNILDVFDLTSIGGRVAIVMEYLEAVDLRFIIQTLLESEEQLPVKAALEIASIVASALDAAYNRPPMPGGKPLRVIHRDIKPSNIMVDEGAMVKVLDFGVARSEIENRESHTQELQFGSVEYMAPERLFFEPETPASDLYSLGATLFEILSLEKLGKAKGRPERHAAQLADRLSWLRGRVVVRGPGAAELESLLAGSLAFEHENRPSAAVFHQRARALSRLVEGEDLQSWAERVIPDCVRRAAENSHAPSSLTNSVVTEDSRVFSASFSGPVAGDAGLEVVDGGALPPGGLELEGRPGEAVTRGALAELESSDRFAAPSPMPVASPGATIVPLDDDWADEAPPPPVALAPPAAAPPAPAPAAAGFSDPSDPFEVLADIDLEGFDPADQETTFTPRAAAVDEVDDLLEDADDYEDEPTSRTPVEPVPEVPDEGPTVVRAPVSVPVIQAGQADEPAPPAAPKKRARWPIFVAMGCLGLIFGIIGIVGFVLWSRFAPMGAVAPDIPSTPASAEPAPPAPAEPVPAPAEGPAILFVSGDPDTAKLKVRCDEASARGESRASVALESAHTCTVTAIQSDRSRHTAVVEGAEAGEYRCFADGAKGCARQ